MRGRCEHGFRIAEEECPHCKIKLGGSKSALSDRVMHNPDYFKQHYLNQPSEILPCPKCQEPLYEHPETPNIKRWFVCPKCKWKSA